MNISTTIVNTVAGALLLAAGSTLVSLKVHDATQDEQIQRATKLSDQMDALSENIAQMNDRLSQLDGRIQGQRDVLISPRTASNLKRL